MDCVNVSLVVHAIVEPRLQLDLSRVDALRNVASTVWIVDPSNLRVDFRRVQRLETANSFWRQSIDLMLLERGLCLD